MARVLRWFLASLVPAAVLAAGVAVTTAWVRETVADEPRRVPTKAEIGIRLAVDDPEGVFERGEGAPSDLPGSWPCFRNSLRDGVGRENVPLAREWPEDGPEVLWSVKLGEGHAGPAVHKGRVYVLDYERDAREGAKSDDGWDVMRCMSLADGKDIWRYRYPAAVKPQHGMSRTVPAVADGRVVSLGPLCQVLCLDAETGAKLWGMSLVRKYGTKVPMWYAGQCPLVENGRVILAPGGQHALLVALDLHTGREIWRTPNPRRWEMTHVSLTPMEFAGRRTYIYEGMKGVAGIAADDGSLVWENADWTGNTAVAASPVVVGENRVFISAGYGAGSMMLELGEEGGRVVSSVAARMKDRAFGSEQHTPIVLDGYIYGVRPNGELVCMNRDAAVAWSSGRQKVFYKGYGPWLAAQGLIYAMEGGPTHRPLGILRLLEATPEGYRQLAEAKVLDGVDAYGPMALAGGLLLVRDNMTMKCLDVAKR